MKPYLKQFDENYIKLYEKAKLAKNQECFSKDKETFELISKILDLIKASGQKPTYENLTNMNLHFLVKILNYNDFFEKELSKELSNELKTFPLIY